MKAHYDLVVVIPIGPTCKADYVEDTIASIEYYVGSSHKIILADDSQLNTGSFLKQRFPLVDVVVTGKPMGKLCGLYITLGMAFNHALNHYSFKAVLRIDTDALVIGKLPEAEAFRLFDSNPRIGVAGQYPLGYDGKLWDNSWPRGQIYKIFHSKKFLSRPLVHLILLRYYLQAKRNGYKRGESVFGGACFYSYSCLQVLQEKGLLLKKSLRTLHLEEDHLFSLLIKSVGFELGNLSGNGMPFGCSWRGLPASPEVLVRDGKKIIHSTRFYQQMKEDEIRDWFRKKRLPAESHVGTQLENKS